MKWIQDKIVLRVICQWKSGLITLMPMVRNQMKYSILVQKKIENTVKKMGSVEKNMKNGKMMVSRSLLSQAKNLKKRKLFVLAGKHSERLL